MMCAGNNSRELETGEATNYIEDSYRNNIEPAMMTFLNCLL